MKFAAVHSQLTAIAELRWRMFVNRLRTRRGKTELASRIIVTSIFAIAGFGAFAMAIGMSWFFVSDGRPEFLAIPLGAVFLFWQFFPVMATAFTNNPDSSELLRFPLAYRAYLLVRLAYGYFDPASALGSVGLLGVLIGVGPVVAALLWSGRRDQLRNRANHVRADINAAAYRALGGESVLSVRVEPRGPWRTGRVHLSAPGGYEFLIASVSGAVISRLPDHYELVVHRG